MKFVIYGENVTITEEMRASIEEKLSFLEKYLVIDENVTARVTVKVYGNSLKVEITIPTKIATMRSEVVHDDFETAVDLAIEKLEDKIRRQKGRLSRRHKESLAETFIDDEDTSEDVAVRTKRVYADEMELDEAIMQMEMLSHTFFIFKDSDSEKLAVVYKRNDGQYGLIEIDE